SQLPSYTEYDFSQNCHLQIPLYVWALEKLTKRKYDGVIWHLSFESTDKEPEKNYPRCSKLQYVEKLDDYLTSLADRLASGTLPLGSQFHQECQTCDYFPYCRYAC
ncbi:MAG: PD-(D/E)XK nuclease family protein, partial [Candidatus Omnitrophica bacterium]|nr:PD-(D/E)XK nuclease family protein [Candidatus Omnitrophota bacterium]